MREFIGRVMDRVFNDYKDNLQQQDSMCGLNNVRFDGGNVPDYTDSIKIQLYLLRYFPAYLVEYYDLYSKILRDYEISDYLYVLSLGCGCGIDYYGLMLACHKHDEELYISYTGVDAVDWPYKDCMDEDFEFIQVDLGEWEKFDWPSYNVIIFPKSIGEFSSQGFISLKGTVSRSQFKKDRIFLVASMRAEHKDTDKERLTEIKEIFLTRHGYSCASDYIFYFDSNSGIVTEFPEFKYPDHILEYITSLPEQCAAKDEYSCKDCSIGRWPILKLKYFLCRIVVLVR